MIDSKNFFDQPIKSDPKTYENMYDWLFVRIFLL